VSIELERVNGVVRSIYRQVDGGIIFADECTCRENPSLTCPVDEHRIRALQVAEEA
jgi:hypothetical protein